MESLTVHVWLRHGNVCSRSLCSFNIKLPWYLLSVQIFLLLIFSLLQWL